MSSTTSGERHTPSAAELGLLRQTLTQVFEYTKARVGADPPFRQGLPGALRRILRFDSSRLREQSLKIVWTALNDSEDYRREIAAALRYTPENRPCAAAGGEAPNDGHGAAEADAGAATGTQESRTDHAADPADGESQRPDAEAAGPVPPQTTGARADPDSAGRRLTELICDPGALFVVRPDGWWTPYLLHCTSAELNGENERLSEEIERLQAAAGKTAAVKSPPRADASQGRRAQELSEKLQEADQRNHELQRELHGAKNDCLRLEGQLGESSDRCDKLERDLKRQREAYRNARVTWNTERDGLKAENSELHRQNADLRVNGSGRIDSIVVRGVLEELRGGLDALQADLTENLLRLQLSVPEPAGPVPGDGNESAAPRERRPVELPPGVRPDSFEAADHLCALEHSCLLVDGYNVTMNRWDTTEVDIAKQRARLEMELSDFCARRRIQAHIVWDGVEADVPPQTGRNTGVQVTFSHDGCSADDLIVDTIPKVPLASVIVVVTSDAGLRRRANSLGANLIGAERLWEVLDAQRQGGTE